MTAISPYPGPGASPTVPQAPRPFHLARAALLVCGAYYLGAKVGLALTIPPLAVSTLWPTNALLLGALLLMPTRTWWVLLLAVLPAHLAAELPAGIPIAMALSWYVSNCAEALIGAAAARRLAGYPLRLDSLRDVVAFAISVVLLAPFLSSFLDAALVSLNRWGQTGFWPTWFARIRSNMLAELTLVPVILTWGQGGLAAVRRAPLRRVLEASLLGVGLLAVCLFVFESESAGPSRAAALMYAPLPFLLWAAVRFGPGGTSAATLVVALLAIDGAVHGRGPFVARSAAENTLSIQLFLTVIVLPLLTLAAVMQERARTQTSLARSEERLMLALSAAQMVVWNWRVSNGELLWSDESRRVLAMPSGAVDTTLTDFWSYIHPEDREAVSRAAAEAVKRSTPFEVAFRVLGPDAPVRWVLAKGKAVYEGTGQPSRLLGVCLDVTKPKQAADALRESERRFGETLTNVEMIAIMLDARGCITFANEYVLRVTGWRHEEVIGRNWHDTFVADNGGAPRAAGLDGGAMAPDWSALHYESAIRTRTGERRLVRWTNTPLRSPDGRTIGVAALGEDVTERRHAEEALRRSEERFAKAFRSSPDAIAITRRADDRIVEVNDRWTALFGYTREEAIGRQPAELALFPHTAEQLRRRVLAGVNGAAVEQETEIRRRDGEVRQVILRADTVHMGSEPCFIVTARDITERKRSEAAAEEQRRQMAHLGRVALLGELSGALAHELNQPLTAILANAAAARRLLAREPLDVAQIREIVEDVIRDNQRAGAVIRRLRALLERGEMQSQPLNLNELVGDVLSLMHSDLIGREVAIDTWLEPSLPLVMGDRVQLQQVVLNLLVNACDAMSGTPAAERRLTILTASSDTDVQLSIADRGTGIPADRLDQVFQPFVTSKKHGLGLGLALCRSIVAAHNGRLWATNNPEGGATFHLVLHCASAMADRSSVHATTPPAVAERRAVHRDGPH
ncbi:MAG TPA: PAS domain S-box protein [Gemmatimonadales bacterium]|nr:PAS domain S-box protein [Gemmatimonadales bacterium]